METLANSMLGEREKGVFSILPGRRTGETGMEIKRWAEWEKDAGQRGKEGEGRRREEGAGRRDEG